MIPDTVVPLNPIPAYHSCINQAIDHHALLFISINKKSNFSRSAQVLSKFQKMETVMDPTNACKWDGLRLLLVCHGNKLIIIAEQGPKRPKHNNFYRMNPIISDTLFPVGGRSDFSNFEIRRRGLRNKSM